MQSITCRSPDAVDLRFLQGVNLATASGSLMQQATDEHEGVQNMLAEGTLGDRIQLATYISQDAAGVALQHFQRFTHALKVPGMGIAPDLHRQVRSQSIVVLSQRDPAFASQGDKLAAGLFIQACIHFPAGDCEQSPRGGGWAMFFSITVVSTAMRDRLRSYLAELF
ncbi:hypothetical protein P775_10535 [Puniceibacterium antarcticum]|uniref:Uncharacterized protein n=1 Tax=Puniceibacterium antarcticum TaxID=1206336 RepID=A0A2G8RFG5_9RHOB|nr:hypothetical protein P775_10535 [Puniceibacterium antarcticum]